jgi:hypothetical protein
MDEEETTDERLTELAESASNLEAEAGESETEENTSAQPRSKRAQMAQTAGRARKVERRLAPAQEVGQLEKKYESKKDCGRW